MRSEHVSRYHRRTFSRSKRSRQHNLKSHIRNTGICWHHHKFGTNDKKYKRLCAFVPANKGNVYSAQWRRRRRRRRQLHLDIRRKVVSFLDSCHRYEFLVDRGVEINVITTRPEDNLTPALYKLQIENGTQIDGYGGTSLTLNYLFLRFLHKHMWRNLYQKQASSYISTYQWT